MEFLKKVKGRKRFNSEMEMILNKLDQEVMLYNWFPLTLRDKIIDTVFRYYMKKER